MHAVLLALLLISSASSARIDRYLERLHLSPLPAAAALDAPPRAWHVTASWRHSVALPSAAGAIPAQLGSFPLAAAHAWQAQGGGTPGGLTSLRLALGSGRWEHTLWGPLPAGAAAFPRGTGVQAEYSLGNLSTPGGGLQLAPRARWRALLRSLAGSGSLAGGLPLGAGLADGGAALDAVCADASTEALGMGPAAACRAAERAWVTAALPRAAGAAFALSAPATTGGGTGGGLPWRQALRAVVEGLDPCRGHAGLAATFASGGALMRALSRPRRRQSLEGPSAGAPQLLHATLSLHLAEEAPCEGREVQPGRCLVLQRELSLVVQARGGEAEAPRSGEAGAAGTQTLGEVLGLASGDWLGACASGDEAGLITVRSRHAQMDAVSTDGVREDGVCSDDVCSDGARSGSVHSGVVSSSHANGVHSSHAYGAHSSRPATIVLSTPNASEIHLWEPPPVGHPDTATPAVRLDPEPPEPPSILWARRQIRQQRLGAGVLVATAALRLPGGAGAGAACRLLFLTPLPWFLGTPRNASGQDSVALWGGGSPAYAAVQRDGATAEVWLSGRARAAHGAPLRATLRLASRVVQPAIDRGFCGLHAAIVDVVVEGEATPEEAAIGSRPQAQELPPPRPELGTTLTLAISLPYLFAGLLHGETECPPDTHRGLDVPPGALHVALLDAGALHADEALEAAARCAAADSGDGVEAGEGCAPHPWALSRGGSAGGRAALLNDVSVEPPCPDFAMPYNVIVLVSTVAAYILGTLTNVMGRKRKERGGGGGAAGS